MKFEIGKTYYGIEPGVQANCREITVLAIEGNTAAVRAVDARGETALDVWTKEDSDLFEDWMMDFYQETPWKRELEVGDRVTFEWQSTDVSHYIMRGKFVHDRPSCDMAVQRLFLRIHKDGTTRFILLPGDLDDAVPYKK